MTLIEYARQWIEKAEKDLLTVNIIMSSREDEILNL